MGFSCGGGRPPARLRLHLVVLLGEEGAFRRFLRCHGLEADGERLTIHGFDKARLPALKVQAHLTNLESPLNFARFFLPSLLPSLAGLFGIANLLDIYATTSHLPPQRENWALPPARPLMVPCFWSSVAGASMGEPGPPGLQRSSETPCMRGCVRRVAPRQAQFTSRGSSSFG